MKLISFPKHVKYTVSALAATAMLASGYAFQTTPYISEAVASTNTITATSSVQTVVLPNFTDLVAQQGPAVVNISVSGSTKATMQGFPGFPQMNPNDPFYKFFKRFQPRTPQGSVPTHGLGSGFIVSSNGVILTNAHVVAGADEVIVKLTDKREFKAKVKGVDKISDVAVLKIDATNLPTVKIGDPNKARVGEWVVAIGSPFGFENSVTAGIISAKSRSLPDDGYVPFLQTDVAVNPGNSGGPLFNTSGEVIGINSQIYSRSGGYQGLSFAIPIDVAMKVEQQLIDHGKVSRGRLGVSIQEVNQQLADTFGLDKPAGALISSVGKNSPAEKAGIKVGDIILQFNGKDIKRSGELPPVVSELMPGSKAKLQIWRKGQNIELSMKVGAMKGSKNTKRPDSKSKKEALGLAVRPLTRNERRQVDVAGGLLVEHLSNGPAAHAGIRPGDIILSVNGKATATLAQFRTLVSKSHKHLALLILRRGQKLFVPLSLK